MGIFDYVKYWVETETSFLSNVPKQDPNVCSKVNVYELDGDNGTRVIPEWEAARAVLVGYPFQVPYKMLKEITNDNELIIVVSNQNETFKCKKSLKSMALMHPNVNLLFQIKAMDIMEQGTGVRFL